MKHILIIRLSAMGDVAMTVPVIRALVQQHPNVKVTIVSRPFFQPFFADIDRVDFFGVDLKERHKGFWGIYRLFQDLKKKKIDFVADFHNVLRSKLLRTFFKASGVKTAFTDKGRGEKKALTRSKNKILKPLKTMIQRHIDTLNTLGFSIDVSSPKFPEKSILPDKVTSIIEKKDTYKWIGIAPFAQYQTKVYPFDLMQKTIQLLSENSNFRIFLFGGGKEEIVQLNKLQQNLPNVAVIAGKIDFIDELKIIQHLDVMLSMDSGNAHIAAMYGIPVVTLWGNTHPYAGFVPFNQPLSNCLVADREKFPLLPTSIYGNKKIDGYENVMRTIEPKDIISVINSNLNV
ncbi:MULTISPECIES: glycosyltransferase family 9 protein [unclassified Flavobacterium]|uniref:glycosyltransferase family 9 protein n=1 Tax=unclassified Flavobacterium TaxID=196869 RepID=UPI001F0A00B5|nr:MULTISPECIES: glycosyltransferase family 9 protein [unclassified Flavobacterium]